MPGVSLLPCAVSGAQHYASTLVLGALGSGLVRMGAYKRRCFLMPCKLWMPCRPLDRDGSSRWPLILAIAFRLLARVLSATLRR